MARIRSLYDALIKTQVDEDKCTNFLIWLLEKLPPEILAEICEAAKLTLSKEIQNHLDFRVQYPLTNSRPDAIIESDGKFLVIETKMYPNAFDKEQFMNHFTGASEEFLSENVWLLFLSGDKKIPNGLNELIPEHQGRIGFLSWEFLLQILKDSRVSLGQQYELVIEEFLIFAQHFKLGRLIAMNDEEMRQFIEKYIELEKFREPCTQKLLQILVKYRDRIIIDCEEKVEKSDDRQKELPCLYKGLRIHGWHVEHSAYIYINILQKMIGICLVGYQNKNEKDKFLSWWEAKLKEKYKSDLKLTSFTWVEEGDDDFAINGGYFKIVEGTAGKLFNPLKIKEFTDCFYFGYTFELNISELEAIAGEIAHNFRRLLDKFLELT